MTALAALSQNRLLCTGVGLDAIAEPTLAPATGSEEAFSNLVSEYYVLFRESLASDVSFLQGVEHHPAVREFGDCIYKLRTAKQHKDNADASRFYSRWTSEHSPWQSAGESLRDLLVQALTALANTSARVRRDPGLSHAWRDRVATEPAAIFEAVCTDLSVSFRPTVAKVLVRNVERRLRGLPPHEDARQRIENWCAEEITGQSRRLPMSYYSVLDHLGLLGDRRAKAALLLAYSIAATTHLRGDDFLSRLEEAWKVTTG